MYLLNFFKFRIGLHLSGHIFDLGTGKYELKEDELVKNKLKQTAKVKDIAMDEFKDKVKDDKDEFVYEECLESERLETESQEKEREIQQKIEKDKLEKERLEKECKEKERLEKERLEQEKLKSERKKKGKREKINKKREREKATAAAENLEKREFKSYD